MDVRICTPFARKPNRWRVCTCRGGRRENAALLPIGAGCGYVVAALSYAIFRLLLFRLRVLPIVLSLKPLVAAQADKGPETTWGAGDIYLRYVCLRAGDRLTCRRFFFCCCCCSLDRTRRSGDR